MLASDKSDDLLKTSPTASEAETSVGFDPPERALAKRYEILSELGRGGMGIVYRARDRETDEVVAVKVLKPEITARQDLIGRFKAELRLARKITHKNVCRTYELLRLDDGLAITMEYVEGESLRSILARFGGVPLRRGLQWAQQVCDGLSEAHAQGVVHRDLKPENIQIDRGGQAKIMDFGIARSLETDATQTVGLVIGTPAYMSPEQAEGKPVDSRTDIYSLGLILYEMFTGRPAFHGDGGFALALKQIHETPPPPCEVEPSLPAIIEEAILRCIEKDPAMRYASVGELRAALSKKIEASVAPLPAASEPLLPAIPPNWFRNREALASLVFFVLVSVMLANLYLSKLAFLEALGVIFNTVVILFVWPRLRRFRAIFWAGMTACAAVWLLDFYLVWRVEPITLALLSKPGSAGPRVQNLALAEFILGFFGLLPWLVFAILFPTPNQLQPKPQDSSVSILTGNGWVRLFGSAQVKQWLRMEHAWHSWIVRVYNSVPFGVLLLAASALLALWLINGLLIDPLARLSAR